jgi:phage gpG-like protein
MAGTYSFAAITGKLEQVIAACQDFQKPLDLCGQYMFKSAAKTFNTSGHGMWKPLAKSTIARRRKKSSKPLLDTGRLRRSVTGKGGKNVYNITKHWLVMGTNVEYARIHQQGGLINRTSKPGSAVLRSKKKKRQDGSTYTRWEFASKKWQAKNPDTGKDTWKKREEYTDKKGKKRTKWKAVSDQYAKNHKAEVRRGTVKKHHTPWKGKKVSWLGGKSYTIRIPSRPFLVIWPEDRKTIKMIIRNHCTKPIK